MNFWLSGLSIIFAFFIEVLPLPVWAQIYRPPLLPMLVIFFVINLPKTLGIVRVWLIGVFLDVITGSLLAEHALALCLVYYLAEKFSRELRFYQVLQQLPLVSGFIFAYQVVIVSCEYLAQRNVGFMYLFIPSLISIFIWPWLSLFLIDYVKRVRVSI